MSCDPAGVSGEEDGSRSGWGFALEFKAKPVFSFVISFTTLQLSHQRHTEASKNLDTTDLGSYIETLIFLNDKVEDKV